jgi:hypothetical protein
MIIGVGCGKSYCISNPTRIFIRNTSPTFIGSDDYEAIEYKVLTDLFDQMHPFRKKAIANRLERAHGGRMSQPVVIVSVRRRAA